MRRFTIILVLSLAGAGAAACGKDSGGGPDAAPAGAPTLAAIKSEIFAKSCVFGTCHGAAVPAAKLDLTKDVCKALVEHKSCLYPDKKLVVAGDPSASFLLDKLHGRSLSMVAPPSGCATTDLVMPYGQPKLSDEKIAQVEEWIRMGADCGTGTPDDGGIDAPVDAAPGSPEEVADISTSATTLKAGEEATVTVTLAAPAPLGGQSVDIDVGNTTVLGAPPAVFVPEGGITISFKVKGKRPAHPVSLTAEAAGGARSLSIAVTGLLLSEIFTSVLGTDSELQWIKIVNNAIDPINLDGYTIGSGRTRYTSSMVPLTGIVQPGQCFIVGGPRSVAGNGNPVYSQIYDFSPDVVWGATGDGQAAAHGLFDIPITAMTTSSLPIDAVLCGANNNANVKGPDGLPAPVTCPDVGPGHSVSRTSLTIWVDLSTPVPGNCTVISQ